ncbi:MAG: hypothetical protein VKS61_12340 [Candidatus Sericytochromatia bacterium]|nr:hypothetical protein [Candidatus Sericytochromatia bacterium]
MTTCRRLPGGLALGLAVASLLGCEAPLAPTDVDAVMGDGRPGRLETLRAGATTLTQLVPGRGAILALGSSTQRADQVAWQAEPGARAWRTEATAARPCAEARLRAWEAPLRAHPPERPRPRRLQAAPEVRVGATDRFWVVRQTAGNRALEARIEARCLVVGSHCLVWLDTALDAEALQDRLQEIADSFDGAVYPTTTGLFGVPLAEGGGGEARVSLLISPAVGNYGEDTTLGYFALRDLFPPDLASEDLPEVARSNHRLLLYMSPLVVGHGRPTDYLGTVAHEFQHLIGASRRIFAPGGPRRPEAVWLDEVLSMVAMSANGFGLNSDSTVLFSHVRTFLAAPKDYSLTHWELNPEDSAYGAAYLFGTYLVERFGEAILQDLVDGPETGRENLEARLAARSTHFEAVFRDWMLATLLDETGFTEEPRHRYRTLALIGGRPGRRLRGVRLEQLPLPSRATLLLKPTSMRFLALPRGATGPFHLGFDAREAREAFLLLP